MAALGSQSIASSYEQLLHVDRDGGGNSTTHVSVKDGDNGTTFGFTIATDALMMSSTNRLEFGDTGTYIHQSADGVLDLVSDTEIEINATTIDMNGAADLSGNLTVGGDIDLEGSIDVNATANLDNTDIDGTLAVDGTTISLDATTSLNIDNSNTSNGITIGTATSGVPISIGHSTSETTVNDNLNVTGILDVTDTTDSSDATGDTGALRTEGGASIAKKLYVGTDLDVDGTANLDAVDIDGAVNMAADLTMGANIIMGDDTSIGISDSDERIEFDGAGDISVLGANFAIGTSTPSSYNGNADNLVIFETGDDSGITLVADNDRGSNIYFADAQDDNVGGISYNHSNNKMTLRGNGSSKMEIDSTGNIGIGASPTTFHGDLTGVQIGGNGILQHETAVGASKTFKIAQNVREEITSGDFTYISTDEASLIELNSGGVNIKTAPSGTAGATATMTQRFSVSQAGAVTAGSTSLNTGAANFTGFENINEKTAGGTGTSHYLYGIRNKFEHNDGDAGFGYLYGLHNHAKDNTSNTNGSYMYGMLNMVEKDAGNTDYMIGLGNYVDFDGGTTDNNVIGLYNEIDIEAGGTISGSVYAIENYYDADTNPGGVVYGYYGSGASNNDYHILTYSGTQSSVTFRLGDNGSIEHEQGISSNQSLDYAEYFESKDGKAIAIGSTVKLDGDKIVSCEDGDTPIGVVRPVGTSSVVGGKQAFHWQGMYETDDYGAYVYEDFTWTQWKVEVSRDDFSAADDNSESNFGGFVKKSSTAGEDATYYVDGDELPDGKKVGDEKTPEVPAKYFLKYKYHTDRIPSDLTVPSDAKVIEDKNKRKKINSDYDHTKADSYKDREERDEWHIIGLLGQVQVTKGQPVASNWIKMKDVSSKVEMYFVK